jgi:WD40 repeat protein
MSSSSAAVWSAPSGDLLAACCAGAVQVWRPSSNGAAADEARLPSSADASPSSAVALDWSANNKVLAVAGDRAQVCMYGGGQLIGQVPAAGAATSATAAAATGACGPSSGASAATHQSAPASSSSIPLTGGITALRFGGDSKRMIVGCRSRAVHVLDLRQQGAVTRSNVDHRGAVCALAVAPGDAAVASAGEAGQLLLHDFRTAVRLATLEGGGGPAASGSSALSAGGGGINTPGVVRRSLAFCPTDAEQLAAAGDDGGVVLWSLRSRALRGEWRGLHGPMGATGVCFQQQQQGQDGGTSTSSSEVMFSVGRDRRLCVLDARLGGNGLAGELRALQPLSCVAARHDGLTVAAGTATGGGVLVFDARALGRGALHAFAFSGAGAEAVREVRWQHAPSAGARARAAAAQARAAVSAAASAGEERDRGRGVTAAVPPPGRLALSEKQQRQSAATAIGGKQGVVVAAAAGATGAAGGLAEEEQRLAASFGRAVTIGTADEAVDSYGGGSRRLSRPSYQEEQEDGELHMLPRGGALSPVRRPGLSGAAAAPASPSGASSQPTHPAPSFGTAAAASHHDDAEQQQEHEDRTGWDADAAAAPAPDLARRPAPPSRRGAPPPAVPPLSLRRAPSDAAAAGQHNPSTATPRRVPSLTPPRAARPSGGSLTPRGGAAAAASTAAALAAAASDAPAPAGVRAMLDEAVGALRSDLRAVHVEVVRQAAAAQLDLASVVGGLAARQDALAAAVAALADRVDAAVAAWARGTGVGVVPCLPQTPMRGGGDLEAWLGH